MCNEPLNREALLPLSCTTHDVFLINKCGPRKHDVPSHLESCTNVLEWGWCVGGLNHCSNINFIHDFYEQLDKWAVVYFLKGNHNGLQWGKSQVDVKELSTRFLKEDIGYEDIWHQGQAVELHEDWPGLDPCIQEDVLCVCCQAQVMDGFAQEQLHCVDFTPFVMAEVQVSVVATRPALPAKRGFHNVPESHLGVL